MNIKNMTEQEVRDETERLILKRFRNGEDRVVIAALALLGKAPTPGYRNKATAKRAIKVIRSTINWRGVVSQEEIEQAVRLLRRVKEEAM